MIELAGGVLHQWETGRCVNIFGDKVQEANEIQFANANDSVAVAVPHRVTMEYDGPEVQIPDRYLQSGKPLIVYVVETREEGNTCRSEILETKVFPVKAKPKPKDYVPTAAEEAYGIVKKLSDDAKEAARKAEEESQHAWDLAEAAHIAADNAAASAELAKETAETLIPLEVTVADGKALYTSLQIHNAVMGGQNVFLNIGHIVPLTTSSNLYAVFVEFVEVESVCKAHIVDSTGIYKTEEFHLSRLFDKYGEYIDLNGRNITNLGEIKVKIYAYASAYDTVVLSASGVDVVLRGILAGESENEAVNVAQLQTVHGVVTDHGVRIDTAEEKLQDAEGAIAYAEQSIAGLSDRMTSAESALTDLSIGLDDAEQALSDAEKNLGDLESTVADTAAKLKEKAEIDDRKVGSAVWSSKNIVDKLCPAFEKTGTLVQCEPVEGYPLNAVAIDGIAGVFTVTTCGKNLYNAERYTMTPKKMIRHGTGIYADSEAFSATKDFIPVAHLRGQTISLLHAPYDTNTTGTTAGIAFYTAKSEDSFINKSGTNQAKITVPETANYMRFSISTNYINEAQIELGESVTEYEPYCGNSVTSAENVAEVAAINGTNLVHGLADDTPVMITVTGRADPAAMISSLMNHVAELEKAAINNT